MTPSQISWGPGEASFEWFLTQVDEFNRLILPKAGPNRTMTITQTTGAKDATFTVWWFCDSIFCEPKK